MSCKGSKSGCGKANKEGVTDSSLGRVRKALEQELSKALVQVPMCAVHSKGLECGSSAIVNCHRIFSCRFAQTFKGTPFH